MLFLPALLFAVAAPPPPRPSPTPLPLKVIFRLNVSPLCANLHRVIMPFVVVERRNNLRFKSMDAQLGTYHQWYRPTSDAATDPNGSPEINGAQALAAARIDQTAALMYKDITHVENLLAQSERAVPPGKDPELDNLRTRARDIMKLQRQIANRYEEQVGTYLNSLGAVPPVANARSAAGDPALQGTFDLPALDQDALTAGRVPSVASQLGLETPPPGSQYGEQQHETSSKEIVRTMVVQEVKFVRPALQTVQQCDGAR